jgi:hypothetical protein
MVTKSGAVRGGGLQTLAAALGIGATVKARAVQLIADAANSGIPLIGGPTMNPGDASPLTAGTGFPILKTAALYLPYSSIWTEMYDFGEIYVYVATGDVLYVLWENG